MRRARRNSHYELPPERWYGNPPDAFGIPKEAHLVPQWPRGRKAEGPILGTPEAIAQWMGAVESSPVERLIVIPVDQKLRALGAVIASQGTLNESVVHPREVFAPAIAARARAVILVHNHPSGFEDWSRADVVMTTRMCAAGMLLGIEILDHVLVARGGQWASMAMDGTLAVAKADAKRIVRDIL